MGNEITYENASSAALRSRKEQRGGLQTSPVSYAHSTLPTKA